MYELLTLAVPSKKCALRDKPRDEMVVLESCGAVLG